ncbi:hypothetical protein CKA32_005859 [Geitlerinema sp. FC II]|nr:hypothetical protein CKA32_005859 [Geitlerinema sp. FC II]
MKRLGKVERVSSLEFGELAIAARPLVVSAAGRRQGRRGL